MNYVEQYQIAVNLTPVPKNEINRVLAEIDVAVRRNHRANAIERIRWPGGSFGPLSLAAREAIDRGDPMLLPVLETPGMTILIVD